MPPLPAFSAPDADSREVEHGAALSEVRRLARRVRDLEAANAALVAAVSRLAERLAPHSEHQSQAVREAVAEAIDWAQAGGR